MFEPPFCPYKECKHHYHPPAGRWWRRKGHHSTACFGPVPRFRCSACHRSFSRQTFSIDFYAKRRIDYEALERHGSSGEGIRALGRNLDCSCGTVINRFDRLARQAIACHSRLRPKACRYEGIAIDGFVSFDRSQYFPNNITISITAESRFALSFSHATLRRSGTMRPGQKKRRDELYLSIEFERKAIDRSFAELLDALEQERAPVPFRPLVVVTDEKIEYRRAFSRHRLFRGQDGDHRTVHLTVNSRLPRTISNPLFPSNYLDREIRKDQAAHRRETTCFARNASNGMARLAVYLGWHNYAKRYLVNWPARLLACHGEVAGIALKLISAERGRIFTERAFLSRERLDTMEERVWRKLVPTPGKAGRDYLPAFAVG